jgi:dissimilatory sulfite reductase (desulfoviridin) alpha/beta subunit
MRISVARPAVGVCDVGCSIRAYPLRLSAYTDKWRHCRCPSCSRCLWRWPELRIRNTDAQPRIVSGGNFGPGGRELSRYFKYMPRALPGRAYNINR